MTPSPSRAGRVPPRMVGYYVIRQMSVKPSGSRLRPGSRAVAGGMVALLLVATACRSDDRVADRRGTDRRNGVVTFVRSRGRVADLVSIPPEGGETAGLGPRAGTKGGPSWAPDGSRLAFVWRRWPSGFNLFVMDADGHPITRVTDGPWIDGTPTWSPDGRSLAFSSNRQADEGFGIYVVDARGGEPRRLARGVAPDWSPTGTSIAFVQVVDDRGDVFVMTSDGAGPRNLTDSPADDRDPDWSPDGSAIAFASDRDGDYDLYVMDADGGGVRQITDAPGDELWPEWAPDGTRLAFAETTPDTSEIWLVDSDGSGAVRLTSGPLFDATPTWRPLPPRPS